MDNKVTKKRINDHLEYDWYWYLVILIVAIVGCYFAFSQINRTRDYEDVNFFVSCYDSGDNSFEARIKGEMRASSYALEKQSKYGENVLRSIEFETQDPLDSNYSALLQTHGMITSDVLIVGEKYFMSDSRNFLRLTDELLKDYILPDGLTIDDLDYYTVDVHGEEARYGIKVSNFSRLPFTMNWRSIEKYKEKYESVSEEQQPDDTFYLIINPTSVNIGKFGKKAKDSNAQALYTVSRFIAYYR